MQHWSRSLFYENNENAYLVIDVDLAHIFMVQN